MMTLMEAMKPPTTSDKMELSEAYHDTKPEAMKHHSATAFHHAVSLMPGAQPIHNGKRYTRRCTYHKTNIYFDAVPEIAQK